MRSKLGLFYKCCKCIEKKTAECICISRLHQVVCKRKRKKEQSILELKILIYVNYVNRIGFYGGLTSIHILGIEQRVKKNCGCVSRDTSEGSKYIMLIKKLYLLAIFLRNQSPKYRPITRRKCFFYSINTSFGYKLNRNSQFNKSKPFLCDNLVYE